MDETVGTIFLFAVAGIILGDQAGRKVAAWMLIGSLTLAIIISPSLALALVLAPLAIGAMGIGALISYFKKR